MTQKFEPVNELELALTAAQQGQLAVPSFIQTLLVSKVFVLADKDMGPAGIWDNSAKVMLLTNSKGQSFLALFTAPERSAAWAKQQARFSFGLLTNFAGLIRHVEVETGVVINPGLTVGLEMLPATIAKLKEGMQPAK